MEKQIKISNMSACEVIKNFPDICPICHYSIDPNILNINRIPAERIFKNIVVCECKHCNSIYAISFISPITEYDSYHIHLIDFTPTVTNSKQFEDCINEISPHFIEIFNQSAAAEQQSLDQICGIGYRKALEFLIKDYLIYLEPDKEDEYKKMLLGQCVDKISAPNIKLVAQRAVWLGNDETHYIRKWTDHDINDLKLLIDLTVKWISMEYNTKKYIESMQQ